VAGKLIGRLNNVITPQHAIDRDALRPAINGNNPELSFQTRHPEVSQLLFRWASG